MPPNAPNSAKESVVPDIEDLNYLSTSEALQVYRYRTPTTPKRGVLLSLLYYLAKTLRAIPLTFKNPGWKGLEGTSVLVGLASRNQLSAVETVIDSLPGSRVLSMNNVVPGPRFPELQAYLCGVRHVRDLLRLRSGASEYKRIGYDHFLDRYLVTYGYHEAALRVLEHIRPELLLVSNDHSMEPRTLASAATQLGITTVYMQHASVTAGFPPLAFDLAFLDGEDAARKYDQATEWRPTVFLCGIAKADDARRSYRDRTELNRLGVCVNEVDPQANVEAFIADLRRARPTLEVVLRPHPRDQRTWDAARLGISVSDAKEVDSFSFLDRIDAIVTGPSNIALEAALVGVRSAFKDFGKLAHDPYGFVKEGLCMPVDTAEDALRALDPELTTDPIVAPLRKYCATVGTSFDGRSAELVQELILERLGGGIDMRRWRKRPDFDHIDVYELAE